MDKIATVLIAKLLQIIELYKEVVVSAILSIIILKILFLIRVHAFYVKH